MSGRLADAEDLVLSDAGLAVALCLEDEYDLDEDVDREPLRDCASEFS